MGGRRGMTRKSDLTRGQGSKGGGAVDGVYYGDATRAEGADRVVRHSSDLPADVFAAIREARPSAAAAAFDPELA